MIYYVELTYIFEENSERKFSSPPPPLQPLATRIKGQILLRAFR